MELDVMKRKINHNNTKTQIDHMKFQKKVYNKLKTLG